MKLRKVLVCAARAVGPDRESGSKRIFDLVEFFRARDAEIALLSRSSNSHPEDVQRLNQLGIPVYAGIEQNLTRLCRENVFDLALLAPWFVAEESISTIRSLSPQSRIIVDTIDLHFLRKSRQHWQESQGFHRPLAYEFASEMIRELNTYAVADGVLTTSQKEAGLVEDFLSANDFAYPVPDTEDMSASPLPFESRCGIVFLGNFWHQPNVSGVQFLSEKVLPRIDPELLRQEPVTIIGHGVERVPGIDKLGNVRVIGWVPSVVPYLHQARISVAPLLFGAGTKRKVIQSLMAGTPTVATRIGTEGLNLIDGQHVLCADDEISFAASIERLLTERELWVRLSRIGRAQILLGHSREVFQRSLQTALDAVFAKPPGCPVEVARPGS